MKKHLITATFAVAIAAMAGYNTYLSHVEDGMSDMVLENVEALADDTENNKKDSYCRTDEVLVDYTYKCFHGGKVGFAGTIFSCVKGGLETECTEGEKGKSYECNMNHLIMQVSNLKTVACDD